MWQFTQCHLNITNSCTVSKSTVPKSLDKAMEQKNGHPNDAGISVRYGPVDDEMDVDEPQTNGKRKSRASTGKTVNYNEVPSDEDSDDVKPVVSYMTYVLIPINTFTN